MRYSRPAGLLAALASVLLLVSLLALVLVPVATHASYGPPARHELAARGLRNLTYDEAKSYAKSYGAAAYQGWVNMGAGVRNAAGFNVSKVLDGNLSPQTIIGGGVGALVMAVIAIVIGAVTILIVGPVLCCCKLTKVPHNKEDMEHASIRKKQIAVAIFSIGFIFVFVALVLAMYSVTFVYQSAENTLNGVYTTTNALSGTLQNSSKLLDGIGASANKAVDTALDRASAFSNSVLTSADTKVYPGIVKLVDFTKDLATALRNLLTDAVLANTTLTSIKANLTLISNAVSGPGGINDANFNLTKTRTYNKPGGGSFTYTLKSGLTQFDFLRKNYSANRDFSTLPNIGSYITTIQGLPNVTAIGANATTSYNDAKKTINDTVNDAKKNAKSTVSSAIDNAQSGLQSAQSTINNVDSQLSGVSTQVNDNYGPMILNYFNIWMIVSQIIMALFIAVMVMGAIGSCAKSPKTTAASAGLSSLCIGLIWILCGIFLFLAIALGTACTYVQQPSTLSQLSGAFGGGLNISVAVDTINGLKSCTTNSSLSVLDVVIAAGILSPESRPVVKNIVEKAIKDSGIVNDLTSKLNISSVLDLGPDFSNRLKDYSNRNFTQLNFTELENQNNRGSVLGELEMIALNISSITNDTNLLKVSFDITSGTATDAELQAAAGEWRRDITFLKMNIDYLRLNWATNIENDSNNLLTIGRRVESNVNQTTSTINQAATQFNITLDSIKAFANSIVADLNATVLPQIISDFVGWGAEVDSNINTATACQPIANAVFATTNAMCDGVSDGFDGYFFAAGAAGFFGFLVLHGLVVLREQLAFSSVAPFVSQSLEMVGKVFRRGGESDAYINQQQQPGGYIGMQQHRA